MKKKLLLSGLILGILLTSACSKEAAPAEKVAVETKKVAVAQVKKEQAVKVSELSGTLQPNEEAQVAFEVAGRIVELNRNEGDKVKQGDVLGRVDASDYSLQLARANTSVAQTGASLEKVNNGARSQELVQAKVILDKAKIGYQKALDDFKKFEKLYQEKAISQNDFDNVKNRLDIAKEDLTNAEQAYSLTTQGARTEDRVMNQASYEQAVISKEIAALTLNKTQLKSPITGTVIAKLTSAGQLANTGSPVYRIGDIDTLKVVLPVPDHEITAWKEGESVDLNLYGKTRQGKVSKIFPATNQSTGTIGVEVKVANPAHDWFAGQVVKVSKKVTGKEGLFVPVEAVISSGETNPYVYLSVGNKAVKTSVSIGELSDNSIEILSGLKEGDQIIVKGADRLFDGDPIEVAGGNNQ